MELFEAWTDGSCKKNGQDGAIGGYAFLIFKNAHEIARGQEAVKNTTNNRMELIAIISAIEAIKKYNTNEDYKIKMYTDSAYCQNCYSQKWYKKWKENGWVNAKKEPVKNADLWEILIPYFENPNFELIKVKGHTGSTEDEKKNEIVDSLAQCAAASISTEAE